MAEAATAGWRVLTIGRPGGIHLRLADLGATWLSCEVPMGDGTVREVLLGNDELARHLQQRAYFGGSIGRYANRIAQARVVVDGQAHALVANGNGHQLHGGPQGFDKRHWQLLSHGGREAVFALHSPDGDQGFPGAADVEVAYRVLDDGFTVQIDFSARVSAATPMALTNHAYFNLDGALTDVRQHHLALAASHFVPVDHELIPSGDPLPVAGTDFDFQSSRAIAARFLESEQQRLAGGYDHAWLLDDAARAGRVPAAELRSADGLLTALLHTDQPALQVYTGSQLAGTPGRLGVCYPAHSGIALEPGLPPDAPNRPHWPSAAGAIARPGQPWHATMRWQFIPAAGR